ncbi:MAG: TraB/GumN family protein [Saprospiraceae bacterium]
MKFSIDTSHHHLLWKIINPKNPSVDSYLYGTIHLRDKKVYFLIDKIKELIKDSDVFIAEYNIEEGDDMQILEYMQFPDNKTLYDFIAKKKVAKIRNSLKKAFKIDIENLKTFKPIAIENIITESIFNNDFSFPMDIELWNFAKENNILACGAESNSSQLHILRNLNLKTQLKSLIEISENTSKYKHKIDKLINYYISQDIAKLYKSSIKTLGSSKKLLAYDRNERIANTIEKYSNDKKVFTAVGAGHLYGKYGLLKLLKEKGFSIKGML